MIRCVSEADISFKEAQNARRDKRLSPNHTTSAHNRNQPNTAATLYNRFYYSSSKIYHLKVAICIRYRERLRSTMEAMIYRWSVELDSDAFKFVPFSKQKPQKSNTASTVSSHLYRYEHVYMYIHMRDNDTFGWYHRAGWSMPKWVESTVENHRTLLVVHDLIHGIETNIALQSSRWNKGGFKRESTRDTTADMTVHLYI